MFDICFELIVKKCICAHLYWLFDRTSSHDTPTQLVVTQGGGADPSHYGMETTNKQVTFREPVSNNEVDDTDGDGNQNERETNANWSSGNSPYRATAEDPSSSYSPYNLAPVLEEPSSSFSEGNNFLSFYLNYY